jgi:hypothetical protein
MKTSLERKVNLLTAYAVASTLVFGVCILSSFNEKEKKLAVDELTAKRINVVDEKGELKMVISDKERQHSGRMNGKNFPKRERPAGIIFFNDEGDECGGLVYAGSTKDGKVSSGMSFTMDQYHDDQVIQILNDEEFENGAANVQRGISINEYPVGSNIITRNDKIEELQKIADAKEREQKIQDLWDKEGSKRRLFIGRSRGNSSGLFLYDKNGKPKMKIYVDEKGNPKIETIGEKGEVKNYLEDNR